VKSGVIVIASVASANGQPAWRQLASPCGVACVIVSDETKLSTTLSGEMSGGMTAAAAGVGRRPGMKYLYIGKCSITVNGREEKQVTIRS